MSSEKSDEQSPSRKCLSDRITFIKYTYPIKDPNSEAERDAEEVIDRPNRVLQVLSAEDGQVTWGEQKLLKLDKGKPIWESTPRIRVL
jgi:hypothetical protein